MQTFDFSTEICLGLHCSGCGEYIDVEGSFDLEDDEVTALARLVREHDGETDIDELNLEEELPEVYAKIREAYRDAIGEATTDYWILEGYRNGCFDEDDGVIDALEEEGLFKFEPDLATLRDNLGLDEDEDIPEDDLEDARQEAFEQWKDEYFDSLTEDEQIAFIEKYYNAEVDNTPDDYDFTVEIPQEIADLAEKDD